MEQGAARTFTALEGRSRVSGGRQCAVARVDRCCAGGPGLREAETLGRTFPRLSLRPPLECALSWLAYRRELFEPAFPARRCRTHALFGDVARRAGGTLIVSGS